MERNSYYTFNPIMLVKNIRHRAIMKITPSMTHEYVDMQWCAKSISGKSTWLESVGYVRQSLAAAAGLWI
jgi:hypothetical protein